MKERKRQLTTKTITTCLASAAMLFSITAAQAQTDFPFAFIPRDNDDGTFNTTININGDTTEFNNLLLGSNVDANAGPINALRLNRAPLLAPGGRVINPAQGAQGFNSQFAQDFVEDRDPVVIRFPQGVFANSYNWEQVRDAQGRVLGEADSRNIVDPFPVRGEIVHDSPATVRLGYPALRGIFDRAEAAGAPLNLLTVLNVVSNDGVSNGRRWESMINDGHDVQDMELGNEFFFLGQRSGTINTEAQWRNRASRIVQNIRGRAARLNRTVRFGIPITYRASDTIEPQRRRDGDQRFNDLITQDDSFFDAIVVHRYVREQREDGILPRQLTANNLRRLLLASRIMDTSLSYARTQVRESKNSIWLTEWGVGGSGLEGIGASFLGSADTYTHLIRNQRRLEMERINWFSTFGSNAQYVFDSEGRRSVTGYGRIYELFRGLLRDSNLYEGIVVTTDDLIDPRNRNVQSRAVNAVAVNRGERRITYLVTNLANRATRLTLRRDGQTQRSYDVRLSGISTRTLRSLNVNTIAPRTLRNQNNVTIPPYSVMRVEVVFDNSIARTIATSSNILKEDIVEAGVTLYPNPTSSDINLKFNGMKTARTVISDLVGKVVYESVNTNGELQLQKGSTFKTGVYIVRVTDENNNLYIKKLVVR